MWTAAAFTSGGWSQLQVITVEGGPFSSARILAAAREHLKPDATLFRYLEKEAATDSGLARDAIELWSDSAEAEAHEFDWTSGGRIRAVEEALGIYPNVDLKSDVQDDPATLAWHDHTAFIIPIELPPDGQSEVPLILDYKPGLREANRTKRLRHRYASDAHVLETILDWRGYFGRQSAVLDGWTKMRRAGRGYRAAFTGTVGYVVGSVLRRLTRGQPSYTRDPTAERRLVTMTERYADVGERYPDLSYVDAVKHDRTIVFVHGAVSCGIQGLKDLPSTQPLQQTYRYEHDTFKAIEENAVELAQFVRERISTNRLLFAAHSRGGLVARLAADDLRRHGYTSQIEIYTFGTPHAGTPLVAIGTRALNLLYKLGEDVVGSLPLMSPLTKAYSYLIDPPGMPRGLEVMREDSDSMSLLARIGDAGLVRAWGAEFDVQNAPSGFGVAVEGALLGAFGQRLHDLVVPTSSALSFGAPEPRLHCSHLQYFQQPAVQAALRAFCVPPAVGPAPAPPADGGAIAIHDDHVVIGGVRVPKRQP